MDAKKDIARINLMDRGRPNPQPGAPGDPGAPYLDPATSYSMSIEWLRENYEAILRQRALFYPAAYSFVRELGRGRQGVVFLAVRQGARGCYTEHAIKVFDPGIYRSTAEYWTDMGRIAQQISKLHKLPSPNLVTRHAYEETNGVGYVQMEVIEGIDLRQMLSSRHLGIVRQRCSPQEMQRFMRSIFRVEHGLLKLQPGMVIYILRGILRGLECLHSSNYLHTDVKPANVMIDKLGYVNVVDFGRAVVNSERQAFLLGSPMYMAPEIHRREPSRPQSDFYSVGLVALEMLLGRRLTERTDIADDDLLRLKLDLPRKLLSMLPSYVLENEELVSILQRFIEIDPAERYATAKEADIGEEGLRVVDKQLVQAGLDSEYARDLADYLAKLADPRTGWIELDVEGQAETSRKVELR